MTIRTTTTTTATMKPHHRSSFKSEEMSVNF